MTYQIESRIISKWKRLIDFWIILSRYIFDKIIIEDELPVIYITPVKIYTPFSFINEYLQEWKYKVKFDIINTELKELDAAVDHFW